MKKVVKRISIIIFGYKIVGTTGGWHQKIRFAVGEKGYFPISLAALKLRG
jgi:hypothetical protein